MLRAKRVTIKWSFTALLLLTCICLPSVICSGNKKNPNDKENNGHSQKTMDQQKNGKSAKLVEPLLSGSDYPTERTTGASPPNTSAIKAASIKQAKIPRNQTLHHILHSISQRSASLDLLLQNNQSLYKLLHLSLLNQQLSSKETLLPLENHSKPNLQAVLTQCAWIEP